jgi:hypothetical protein
MTYRYRHMTRGQSLVEFALIAPLLFAMMFILVELGIIFSIYVGLTNSAREGARAGVAYQYVQTSPASTPATNTVDADRAVLMDVAIANTLNPIIRVDGIDDLGTVAQRYTYPEPAQNNYRYGDIVRVTLTYSHSLFFGLLGPSNISLTAQSEMRLEPGGHNAYPAP